MGFTIFLYTVKMFSTCDVPIYFIYGHTIYRIATCIRFYFYVFWSIRPDDGRFVQPTQVDATGFLTSKSCVSRITSILRTKRNHFVAHIWEVKRCARFWEISHMKRKNIAHRGTWFVSLLTLRYWAMRRLYYYYVSCHRLILPGNSLEPTVIPTAQASSFTLQYFPYYVWCSKYSCLL
jgi:hypothetical protein